MLNEVKHLVLLTGGFCFPRTRFFVAALLRMPLAKSMSFREKREIPVMLLLLVSSLEMKGGCFRTANGQLESGQGHKYFRRITQVEVRRYARQCRRPTH